MSSRSSKAAKADSSKASSSAAAAAKLAANMKLVQDYLKQQGVKPAAKPAPAKPAAGGGGSPSSKPAETGPAKPALVDPFMNAADLQALNDFSTNYANNLADIDFNLGNQATTTAYNETVNNANAKEQTAATADSMAARGLFRSSIKDAALYDIEAQRALSNKFLDDSMTAATLHAGTQKQILAQSKTGFDNAMATRKVENASAVNDPLSAAWAGQMATWTAAHPQAAAAAPAAPKPGTQPAAGGWTKPKPAPKPKSPTLATYSWGGKKTVKSSMGSYGPGYKAPAAARVKTLKPAVK